MTAIDSDLVACHDVGLAFGRDDDATVAVYGVTCTVAPRDRIALVGPSGSGKSTLLHLMAGLLRPTSGEIRWPSTGDRPPGAELVGLAFQAPSLVQSMTVRENVELAMLVGGHGGIDTTTARSRADDALDRLGLYSLRHDLPEQISSGQAQRVVLARTLAARPPLVLADEPTSRLDRYNADLVADVLLQVCDSIDAALVVATHDAAVGARLPVTWPMRDGRLHAARPTSGAHA